MEVVENVSSLRSALKKVHSGCAGDTIFIAKAMLVIAEQVDRIERRIAKPLRKRKYQPAP